MMNRFRITFSVDATHLGDILAQIHGQVSDLDVALVESVPHTKNVKREKRPRGGTRDLIVQALQRAPDHTLSLAAAKKLLDQAGFVGDGIYTAKNALVKRGTIEYKNGVMRLPK
jgi:hypothetical protein